jgi:hypothetical protein
MQLSNLARRALFLLVLAMIATSCQLEPAPPSPAGETAGAAAEKALIAKLVSTVTPSATKRPATATMRPATPTVPATPTEIPPTLTARPTPTVQATLTPQPTPTVPPVAAEEPVVTIDNPVIDMFLPSPVTVSGKVLNVSGGRVRLQAQTPDGQPLGLPPVLAASEVVTDGLTFSGTLELGFAPTPRPLLIAAEYLDDADRVIAFAQQPANAIGRYARVQYVTVEMPLPFTRNAEPEILVHGAAPGPPHQILVRLLDAQDQVLDQATAMLGWYQQGLPCDFAASVENLPQGTTIQVLSLGEDEQVLEQARIQLGQPVQ